MKPHVVDLLITLCTIWNSAFKLYMLNDNNLSYVISTNYKNTQTSLVSSFREKY